MKNIHSCYIAEYTAHIKIECHVSDNVNTQCFNVITQAMHSLAPTLEMYKFLNIFMGLLLHSD